MRVEDVIPFLAMIAYVALLLFKRRRQSGADAKSRAAKKQAQNRTQDNAWDQIQGKTQDKFQGKTQQEKPRSFFRVSSMDSNDSSNNYSVIRGREAHRASSNTTGLFSKLGERLKGFFSELEQQFRMEAEKARMKGQAQSRESDNSPATEQGLFTDFDLVDFESPAFTPPSKGKDEDSKPVKVRKTPTAARAKEQASVKRVFKEPLRAPRSGVNLKLSPEEIRTAVIWSEILAPPLALRTGKRPWEN